MATVSEIPLTASQPQTFNVSLAGTTYQFNMYWIGPSGGVAVPQPGNNWNLDIADNNGNQLVAGVPMLPGADLMAQFPDLGFPGQLWVVVDYDSTAVPGFNDFGVNAHLYFVVP